MMVRSRDDGPRKKVTRSALRAIAQRAGGGKVARHHPARPVGLSDHLAPPDNVQLLVDLGKARSPCAGTSDGVPQNSRSREAGEGLPGIWAS